MLDCPLRSLEDMPTINHKPQPPTMSWIFKSGNGTWVHWTILPYPSMQPYLRDWLRFPTASSKRNLRDSPVQISIIGIPQASWHLLYKGPFQVAPLRLVSKTFWIKPFTIMDPCNQWLLMLPACGDTGGVTSTDSCDILWSDQTWIQPVHQVSRFQIEYELSHN